MIKNVVTKHKLGSVSEIKKDLEYWMSKTPEERIDAVIELRRKHHGTGERLQRVIKVVKREKR